MADGIATVSILAVGQAGDVTGDPHAWPGPRGRHGGVDEVPLPGTAGRLWLCGKHYVGPAPELALESVGADRVVCLCERDELGERYPGYVDWLASSAAALWFPVPDLHAPDLDAALPFLRRLLGFLRAGEGLLLHCGAGIGRAGTLAAALLMGLGETREGALATVAAARPLAGPEAGAQAELLVAIESCPGGGIAMFHTIPKSP